MSEVKKTNKWLNGCLVVFAAIIMLNIVVGVTVGVISAVTGNDSTKKEEADRSANFRESYMEGCVVNESFRSYCDCMIDALQDRYSTSFFFVVTLS